MIAAYIGLALGIGSAIAVVWIGPLAVMGSGAAVLFGLVALASTREHRTVAGLAALIGAFGFAYQAYVWVSLLVTKG